MGLLTLKKIKLSRSLSSFAGHPTLDVWGSPGYAFENEIIGNQIETSKAIDVNTKNVVHK